MFQRLTISSLIITLLLNVGVLTAHADTVSDSAQRASAHLTSLRDSSGSIGGVGFSGWAIQGIAATGNTSAQTVTYLENNLGGIETNPATDVERTILAVLAGGRDPHSFGGKDLVAILKTKASGNQIGSTSQANDDIYGILALLASGESIDDPVVTGAIQFLLGTQRTDGSFSWSTSGDGDTNDTAAAIQALRFAQRQGYQGPLGLTAARSYLVSAQNNDGGFGYQPGQTSDGSSTGSVIMAINALNESPETWIKNGNTPFSFLQSLQASSGGVRWQADSEPDIFTTSFAAIAFARKALPVAVMAITPSPSPSPTPTPTLTPTPSPSPSLSPSPLPSISPSPSPTPSVTATPTPSSTPIPTPTPTPTSTPNPSPSPTPIPAPTPTSSPSPSPSSPSPSPTPTPTPTATPAATPTPSPSPDAVTALTGNNGSTTQATLTTAQRSRLTQPLLQPSPRVIATLEPVNEPESSVTIDNQATSSPTPSPTPAPEETPSPEVAGTTDSRNFSAINLIAMLAILLGLILITWGAVTAVKRKNRPISTQTPPRNTR